jgi:teichuronic acid biosynthesis glycosyltransferase TuaC
VRVLAVTNLWPTATRPDLGTFVKGQVEGLRRVGLDVDVEFVDRADRGRLEYYRLARRVGARIACDRPDVLHVMYGGILAERSTRAAVRAGLPTVVSFCGADLLGEHFDGHRLGAAAGVRASKRAATRADAVIVKSDELAAALPANLAATVDVIANGIDLELFRAQDRAEAGRALGWDAAHFNVAFMAHRQSPSRKRPELAAAACAHLRRLGVDSQLHVITGIPHRDVPTVLNAADALLITSAQEGSPNIVREALACGTPVVSVAVGDVGDQLASIPGCRITGADPVALGSALAEVAAAPGRIDAAEYLAERSIEAVAEQVASVYRGVTRT